ncbi:MAG: hypothetical protein HC794_10910, partial [Nitrospiraceae bacterium]|nr:hypothetical protein [Nitrospiraceae bacterium]
VAAERGFLDAVIEPRETRPQIVRALRQLAGKRQKLPPKNTATCRFSRQGLGR